MQASEMTKAGRMATGRRIDPNKLYEALKKEGRLFNGNDGMVRLSSDDNSPFAIRFFVGGIAENDVTLAGASRSLPYLGTIKVKVPGGSMADRVFFFHSGSLQDGAVANLNFKEKTMGSTKDIQVAVKKGLAINE